MMRRLTKYADFGALGAERRGLSRAEGEEDAGPTCIVFGAPSAVRLVPESAFSSLVKITAALVLGLCLALPAEAQVVPEIPVIVTQGEAIVRQAADVAWVQIAVEARGANPSAARQQAAASMTSVMNTLKRLLAGDAIKTSSFSIQPEMEYSDNKPRVRDYVARNQIEARVDDLDKLPGVLDAAVSSGATSIAGMRFDLKKRDDAEREALRLAVEDGMVRAAAIARGAKRDLGNIVRIEEQRSVDGPIRPMMRMAAGNAAAVETPTPVTPGDVEIHAAVTLTVAIK
jgi:uncharacterized protein YggE